MTIAINTQHQPVPTQRNKATFDVREGVLHVRIPLTNGISAREDLLNVIDRPATQQDKIIFQTEYDEFVKANPELKFEIREQPLSPEASRFQQQQRDWAAMEKAKQDHLALRAAALQNLNRPHAIGRPVTSAEYASQFNQEPMQNGQVVPSNFDPQTALINSKSKERVGQLDPINLDK